MKEDQQEHISSPTIHVYIFFLLLEIIVSIRSRNV